MSADPLAPAHLDAAFELVERHVREGRIPGAALGIARSDGDLRTQAFSPPGGPELGADNRFLVASITKPIVATAVMQLVARGSLVLSDPVARYLPEFAPQPSGEWLPGGEAVTTWHLLTHTSGLRDTLMGVVESAEANSAEKLYRQACKGPLLFPPGTEYRYCSDSFYVLGELVSRLSGLAYPDYLQERIFAPLGMTATAFEAGSADDPRRAPLFEVGHDGPTPEALLAGFVSLAHPGGGLWSSVPDLLRFGRAFLDGDPGTGRRLLPTPFVEMMTREHTAGILEAGLPPREPRYGLGWGKSGLSGARIGSARQFDHGGATGTRLWVDPEYDLVVAFLMNRWGEEDHFSLAAIQAVYGALEG